MSPDEEHQSVSRRSNVPKVRVRFLPLYQWSAEPSHTGVSHCATRARGGPLREELDDG